MVHPKWRILLNVFVKKTAQRFFERRSVGMGASQLAVVCCEYPPKKAFYVEKDLEFGDFYWDILDDYQKAQQYTFWEVATLEHLMRLYEQRQEFFYKIIVKEGIVEWDRFKQCYVLVERYAESKQRKRIRWGNEK